MKWIAPLLMMTSILSGCAAFVTAPPVSGGALIPIPQDLMEQLQIRPNDDPDEVAGKLRLWGRYICITEGDCPAVPLY